MPFSSRPTTPRTCVAKLIGASLLASALAAPALGAAAAGPTPTPTPNAILRVVSAAGGLAEPSPTATSTPVAPRPTATPPQVGVLRRVGDPPQDNSLAGVAARIAAPATSTAVPTATAEPTETPTPSPTPIELPKFEPAKDAVKGHVEGNQLLLEVPIRSQFDGTEFQASNCGPTSLAMVLDAFGVASKTFQVRNLVNVLANNFDTEQGTSLDALSWIANQAGLREIGLYDDKGYHHWTTDDVREEVRHGHPVITLVRYRDVPGANMRDPGGDAEHYVVVVGLDGGDFLINDPALPGDTGYRRQLTADDLQKAWADASIPAQAVAYAATDAVHELDLPDPATPSATPEPPVYLTDTTRDTWRLPGELDVPATPTATPTPPPTVEAAATATPEPTATATPEPALWDKSVHSVDPEPAATTAPPPAPSRKRDVGLLSLLSLPLFFVRSTFRLPG